MIEGVLAILLLFCIAVSLGAVYHVKSQRLDELPSTIKPRAHRFARVHDTAVDDTVHAHESAGGPVYLGQQTIHGLSGVYPVSIRGDIPTIKEGDYLVDDATGQWYQTIPHGRVRNVGVKLLEDAVDLDATHYATGLVTSTGLKSAISIPNEGPKK